MNHFLLFSFIFILSVSAQKSNDEKPAPKTKSAFKDRLKEDLFGILDTRSRAHFDDLARFINDKAQLHSCFAPEHEMSLSEFQHLTTYLAGFYQHLTQVEVHTISEQSDYIYGYLRYNASGADGKDSIGRWEFAGSRDEETQVFSFNYLYFVGDCSAIPKTPPAEPLEEVDNYLERVRTKLFNGLFLPDEEYKTRLDFEELGDWITDDATVIVCDEPKMNKNQLIEYMSQRYHHTNKYENNSFTSSKNNEYFEIVFSTTFTSMNDSKYRDTYIFRVKKVPDYYPEMKETFQHWKIYWITKKCALDHTDHPKFLHGSIQLQEVNKRFCGLINGANWDVFQAFLDLFDPKDTKWGSCTGSRDNRIDTLRDYLTKVSMRYAKCTVSEVKIRNLEEADFSTTFLMSRANEVQEQEEVDVGFSGIKDANGHWKMDHMYFECEESKRK